MHLTMELYNFLCNGMTLAVKPCSSVHTRLCTAVWLLLVWRMLVWCTVCPYCVVSVYADIFFLNVFFPSICFQGTQSLNPHNDYCQHFVDTGHRPQNFIRDVGECVLLCVSLCAYICVGVLPRFPLCFRPGWPVWRIPKASGAYQTEGRTHLNHQHSSHVRLMMMWF